MYRANEERGHKRHNPAQSPRLEPRPRAARAQKHARRATGAARRLRRRRPRAATPTHHKLRLGRRQRWFTSQTPPAALLCPLAPFPSAPPVPVHLLVENAPISRRCGMRCGGRGRRMSRRHALKLEAGVVEAYAVGVEEAGVAEAGILAGETRDDADVEADAVVVDVGARPWTRRMSRCRCRGRFRGGLRGLHRGGRGIR